MAWMALLMTGLVAVVPSWWAANAAPRDRAAWVALARGGFVVPDGERAVDLLVEMVPLLASPDHVLLSTVTQISPGVVTEISPPPPGYSAAAVSSTALDLSSPAFSFSRSR
jgi:hypothetical protein